MTERPWMTALEQQATTIRRLRQQSDKNPQNARRLADRLGRAECFSWEPSVIRAVSLASQTLPERLVLDLHPEFPISWWWFAAPLAIIDPETASVIGECS